VAKRFADDGIWDKRWFRLLPPLKKLAFFYLTGRCDRAGFWEIDYDRMAFEFGLPRAQLPDDILADTKDVVIEDGYAIITDFIPFQYGTLSPTNKAHTGILSLLERYKKKGLGRGLQALKETEEETEKEKEEEEEEEEGGVGGELERQMDTSPPPGVGKFQGQFVKVHPDTQAAAQLWMNRGWHPGRPWRQRVSEALYAGVTLGDCEQVFSDVSPNIAPWDLVDKLVACSKQRRATEGHERKRQQFQQQYGKVCRVCGR